MRMCRRADRLARLMAGGLLVLTPVAAAAQTAKPPVIEIGADISSGPDGDGSLARIGPRLEINLDARTALDLSVSPDPDRSRFSHVNYVFVDLRRSLHAFDRATLFGTLGVGHSTRVVDDPVYRREYPRFAGNEYSIGPSVGVGVEAHVAPFLELRVATEVVWSEDSVLRFVGGATVPIGHYRARSDAFDLAVPVAGPLRYLRPGRTVAVTTSDGLTITGEIVSRATDGVTISAGPRATRVSASSIRRVDVPDGLADGLTVGALVGGGGGAAFGFYAGVAICESDGPCAGVISLLFAGMGAGIGALSGAVADSFHDNWRPIYGAESGGPVISVVPLVSRDRIGAGAQLRW